MVTATDWFLTPFERGNPATSLDRRHPSGHSWTTGNDVLPLVHGVAYFTKLVEAVRSMKGGDLVMFTDWRGDPDELLDRQGTTVGSLLCQAAASGVLVRGLVWRSHLDRLQFSERGNRHLGKEIDAAGGVCLLDMRVRTGGSHHQKFVVLRHPGRPELDCAFAGGIDLCHSRRDDATHAGDRQSQPMAAVYGTRPPWHDVQLHIRGPAVGDIEAVFRERWDDPSPLSRNPLHLLRDRLGGAHPKQQILPPQMADPKPCGIHAIQLLRTYPYRRPRYPFAPDGERSVARGITKVLQRARRLVYIEDQYLWSREVVAGFCRALREHSELRLIAVIPRYPDQDGRFSTTPNLIGRYQALKLLQQAGGPRVAIYGLENREGNPIYVHAKVCVVDDEWASVGSDNLNRRSWTHDSELSCAIVTDSLVSPQRREGQSFALGLRLTLAREHLDRADGDDEDLADSLSAFTAFASAAAKLDNWHAAGRQDIRPPGRLRAYPTLQLSRFAQTWSMPLYRAIYDPDGRPRALRTGNRY